MSVVTPNFGTAVRMSGVVSVYLSRRRQCPSDGRTLLVEGRTSAAGTASYFARMPIDKLVCKQMKAIAFHKSEWSNVPCAHRRDGIHYLRLCCWWHQRFCCEKPGISNSVRRGVYIPHESTWAFSPRVPSRDRLFVT